MKIADVIQYLEQWAPLSLQEDYDNSGLLVGDPEQECSGIMIALDASGPVIREAMDRNCNLLITHHPLVFKGLKKFDQADPVARTLISAIRSNLAIYSIHTNLDNILEGVNGKIASLLQLENIRVLQPMKGSLKKLYSFVPLDHIGEVREAVFYAGAGVIGKYDQCSFNAAGEGTYRAGQGTNPYRGKQGELHVEKEVKVEIIFPAYLEKKIIAALIKAHPYEEVAYDVITLDNRAGNRGAGLIGELAYPAEEEAFLDRLKEVFQAKVIRHSLLRNKPIKKVALCGGAGSFLVSKAISSGADVYITADLKYHDFFTGEMPLLLADPGHYESEQFTVNLLQEVLLQKFPTFAVLKSGSAFNPVHYR